MLFTFFGVPSTSNEKQSEQDERNSGHDERNIGPVESKFGANEYNSVPDSDNVDNKMTVAEFLLNDFNLPPLEFHGIYSNCLLYTSPSPRDQRGSRMPSSA